MIPYERACCLDR